MRTPSSILPAQGHLAPEGPNVAAPFEGFDPPESNFWRLPNSWFDVVTHFTSWAEHKVVEYILRHTWGYQEYGIGKLITMDEFMHGRKRRDGSRLDAGCGMAENSIKKGIADAVTHGFLIVQTDDSDRGRIKKYYAPRMRQPQEDEGEHARMLPPSPRPPYTGAMPAPMHMHSSQANRMPETQARAAAAVSGHPGSYAHHITGDQGQRLGTGGQPLRDGEQFLTPDPHALTLGNQHLIPEPQSLIPRVQSRILSLPDADPRTEQIPLVKQLREDTRKQQQGVAAARPLLLTGTTGLQPPVESTGHTTRSFRGQGEQGRLAAPPRSIGARRAGATSSHFRHAAPAAPSEASNDAVAAPPEPLLDRLLEAGVAPAKAQTLIAQYPPARIERQLAWLDSRRCQNRVGTLITAIERDYGPPTPPAGSVAAPAFDPAKFYRGSYAVCPVCGCRPCAQGCEGAPG